MNKGAKEPFLVGIVFAVLIEPPWWGCGWEWLLEDSRTKQLKAITGIFGGERIEHPNDRQGGIYFMHSETGPQAGTCGKGVGPEKLQQREAIALN